MIRINITCGILIPKTITRMICPYFIFLCLVLSSFLTRPNKLCDDQNEESIDSLEECKMASNYLPRAFLGEQIDDQFPKGCYLSTITNQVYYNSHSNGARNFIARHICKTQGTLK